MKLKNKNHNKTKRKAKAKAYQRLDWFLHVHRPLQNLDGYFEGQKPARQSIKSKKKKKNNNNNHQNI